MSNSKTVKKAAKKTLDTIAFDSLRPIVENAEDDMSFQGNARRALGMHVLKAKPQKLEASVVTLRGWFAQHNEERTRRPSGGFRFNGKRYIMVPIEPFAFTKKKRMKAAIRRGSYTIPYGQDALVFFRASEFSKATLIAILKPEVRQHVDTHPEIILDELFILKANRLLNFHLDKLSLKR